MLNPYIPELSEPARRWVRFAALVLALGLLCWISYALRAILTPLLAGLAIAYILNPVVTWIERTRRVSRVTVVVVAFTVLGAFVLIGGIYGVSSAVGQFEQLRQNIPNYVEMLGRFLERMRAPASQPTSAPGEVLVTSWPSVVEQHDWYRHAAPLIKEHGASLARKAAEQIQAGAFGVANLISLLLLVPMYTFFFLWHFNDIARTIREHLPAEQRETIVHVVTTIDAALANFFRGRLLVCLGVGTASAIGWSIVGVPYSVPLGILAGMLNLVPFMSVLVVPPALLFTYLATPPEASWAWPVMLTMGVYFAVQALESFLLSPLIEGRASGLHPLTIVVALLIGGQLAGLLGMLLAIPITSTLKTLAAEWLLPEIRRLARDPKPPAPPPEAVEATAGPATQERPDGTSTTG